MTHIENARRAWAGVIQRAGGLFTTYDSRTSGKTQLLVGPRFERQIATVTGQPDLIADHVEAYSRLDPVLNRI